MSKYNVGDKFIIEIDEISEDEEYYRLKNISYLSLTSYSIDKLEKYEEEKIPYSEAYNKGMNDAWKLARKIFTFNNNKMEEIFGVAGKRSVFDDLSPQVALVKLKIYEKEQEKAKQKIMVGDIITLEDGTKGVVMDEDGVDNVVIFTENGCIEAWMNKKYITKTGKHIDIQSVLEQIKE